MDPIMICKQVQGFQEQGFQEQGFQEVKGGRQVKSLTCQNALGFELTVW
jgi:hypothetical protein